MKSLHGLRPPVLVLLAALSGGGCANTWLGKQMPWAEPESVPGIKTADQRIKEYNELVKAAPKSPPPKSKKSPRSWPPSSRMNPTHYCGW